jgi:hypothetical protein
MLGTRMAKSRKEDRPGHVARIGEMQNSCRILVEGAESGHS